MQFNVSGKLVGGALGTIAVSFIGWLAHGNIENSQRIRVLESDTKTDTRQDRELADIRATVRDLIRLASSAHSPVPVSARGFEEDVPETDAEYEGFQREQSQLEDVLRHRGIQPAEKLPLSEDQP